jgi:hypothetical protein
VFNDAGRQPGAADVGALADIEQQLNAALNRGVANLDSSQWLIYSNQYQSGDFNQYAKVLHDNFIGNKAYAFGEDEQGFAAKFDFLPLPDTATITLGPVSATRTSTTSSSGSHHAKRSLSTELGQLVEDEFRVVFGQLVELAEMAVGMRPSPSLQNSVDGASKALNANPQDHTPLGNSVLFLTSLAALQVLNTEVGSLTPTIPI